MFPHPDCESPVVSAGPSKQALLIKFAPSGVYQESAPLTFTPKDEAGAMVEPSLTVMVSAQPSTGQTVTTSRRNAIERRYRVMESPCGCEVGARATLFGHAACRWSRSSVARVLSRVRELMTIGPGHQSCQPRFVR